MAPQLLVLLGLRVIRPVGLHQGLDPRDLRQYAGGRPRHAVSHPEGEVDSTTQVRAIIARLRPFGQQRDQPCEAALRAARFAVAVLEPWQKARDLVPQLANPRLLGQRRRVDHLGSGSTVVQPGNMLVLVPRWASRTAAERA